MAACSVSSLRTHRQEVEPCGSRRRLLLLLPATLLLVCQTAGTPVARCSSCRGPRFSWETVPAFIHGSNSSGPVNPAALALMAKFPMVTVEKFQGPCANHPSASPACRQEDQIIQVLRGVKKINPNVSTVFYYNSVLDFQQYALHAAMISRPELMLHDAAGRPVRMSGGGKSSDVFDFSNPATRRLFIEECLNATRSGVVDGCFADRAVDGTPSDSTGGDLQPCAGPDCRFKLNLTDAKLVAYAAGHVQVLTELQQALGEGPLVANHAFGPPHDNMAAGSVSFSMIETFGPNNASIQQLLLNAANGRGVQAHGKPTEDSLAAFLVGAGYRAYYGVGGWSEHAPDMKSHWMPQFGMPLGEPLADGAYDHASKRWTRRFMHGVSVSFDVGSNKGTITGLGSFDQ